MIKPATLWGLMKSCEDPVWIGKVCLALGGHEVELDFGQKQMVAAIKLDSGWMDERMDDQRARWAERQRKCRAAKKSQDVTGDYDVTVCHGDSHAVTIHPSVPPSVRPSNQSNNNSIVSSSKSVTVMNGSEHPSYDRVKNTATSIMGIPEYFVSWWYKHMESADWKKVSGGSVNNDNWRPTLMSWWSRADESQKAKLKLEFEASKPKVVVVKKEDWFLCCERCSNCTGNGCTCGVKVPPASRNFPPEECPHYKSKENNDGD